MLRRIVLVLGLVCLSDESDWGYVGEKGPTNWDDLFPQACSGRYQSPIDINTSETVYNPQLKDFAIFFDPPSPGSKFFVHNNGHAVQVDTNGKFYVSNGGLPNIYSTAQFHFHWGHKSHHGSEHTVDGKAAPIEMHIVNWNSDKFGSIAEAATEPEGLAVLGVLFEISPQDNPVLEPIVQVLLDVRDPDMKIKAELPAQSMRAFLPPAPEWYYRYSGSLTTPKCFESVIWTVFKEKQSISRRQLHVFRQVLKPKHHKRHTKHSRAERTVLEELGIMDNPVEKARLRRNLEKKMQADSTAAKETFVLNDPEIPENTSSVEVTRYETHGAQNEAGQGGHQTHHTEHPDAKNQGSEHGGHSEPKQDHSGHHNQQPTVLVESYDIEIRRHNLVNNYRPVQPLNGRVVYRSFPFFDTPIPSQSRSKMDTVPVKEPVGASSAIQFSFLTLALGLSIAFS